MQLDLISSGTETSATAVEWAVAEVIQQPHILQKLQSELTTVIGTDRVVQESDLPNLPFLHAVVKETLRLHPPAALNLPRESTRAFTFRGYNFPKHTRLVTNFFAIHRDPSVYGESAEEFRPERFVERPEVNPVAAFEFYELTPFSAGRRMCPAADLGYMMVCLMLAHLMHAFEWELPAGVGEVDMAEQFGLTVNLKSPLRLVAKPKRPAFLY